MWSASEVSERPKPSTRQVADASGSLVAVTRPRVFAHWCTLTACDGSAPGRGVFADASARTMPAPARTIRRRRAPIPSARGERAPSPPRRRRGPIPPPRGRAWTPRRDSTRARRPRRPAGAVAGRIPFVRPGGGRARARAARRDGSVTGVAPSRISWLVPAAARFCTAPGTAITSIERSSASRAVVSDPPRSRLSTTTSTSLSAARMRLRIGNRNFSGAVPGGHSDSSRPSAADRPPQLGVLARVRTVEPVGRRRRRRGPCRHCSGRRGGRRRRCPWRARTRRRRRRRRARDRA